MGSPPQEPDRPSATPDDGAALRDLYVSEAPRLSRFFGRANRGRDEAADLVHDAFMRFAGATATTGLDKPAAYLRRIARNLLFDRARQRARRGEFDRPIPLEDANLATPADQGYAIEAAQMMDAYQRALDALPPRTRQVFVLHRGHELSYREIAERLGIGIRTVEWHITEALVRIRRALDEA